ncbi:MAG: NUDIX domain-containing protein [Rubripirellula sp.]
MSNLPPKSVSSERSPRGNFENKRGVVGVIFREERLLIIRRALTVTAPGKLCLPGGTVEEGEEEHETLVREMQEELTIDVEPVRLCWRSVTPWGTRLAWWLARLDHATTPIPFEEEVSEYFWMTPAELRGAKGVLPSLPAFISAWERGEIDLKH